MDDVVMTPFPPEDTPYLIWCTNFYDHVLSGLGRYDGRTVWIELLAHIGAPSSDLTYGVYPLDDDEIAAEQRAHLDFERMVGTHTCYHLPARARRRCDSVDDNYWRLHPPGRRSYIDREPLTTVELYRVQDLRR